MCETIFDALYYSSAVSISQVVSSKKAAIIVMFFLYLFYVALQAISVILKFKASRAPPKEEKPLSNLALKPPQDG